MTPLRTTLHPAPGPLHSETAVSTLIGVILMVTLMVLLTVILSAFLVGITEPPQQTAHIVADARYGMQGSSPVVSLVHRGGDPAHFAGDGTGHSLEVLVSSGGSTIPAVPDPAGLPWSMGTTLSIIRSGSGYTLTGDPARFRGTPRAFPPGELTVSVMDTTRAGLVYQKTLMIP